MELELKINEVLRVDEEGFICFTGRDYLKQPRPHSQQKAIPILNKIIDSLGERSATAQKLKQIITTTSKFYGTDQRIYIKVLGNKALGFIKVGEKKLFYHDQMGSIKELMPTSVLDFYVHQSCQRTGIGKEIFDKFLRAESKSAEKLAYDRPSEKLIGFLKKYHNLSSHIPQNNNYVIFDRYFSKVEKPKTTETQKGTRNLPMAQKINMNKTVTKVEQETVKKSKTEVNSNTIQQPSSFKTVKDQSKSSFGCPWAVEEKIGFKTTSNSYGNHYHNR